MDPPRLSIPRSASLPTSSDNSRPSARQLPLSCEPDTIVNAPMTPPLSPHQSQAVCDENSVVTDSDTHHRSCVPSEERVGSNGTFVNMEVDSRRVATPYRQPARSLDDEMAHVEPPGKLKLTDFEVKGTLGTALLLVTPLSI
jgi:hypothetical protein